MDIVKIVSIGLIATALSVYFAKENKDYALYISLAAGVIILMISISYIAPVISVINDFAQKTTISSLQLKAVLKIIATAYLAQFASEACKDAGQGSIASKIETSARFMIVYFSLPIILSLFEYISSLL